MMGSFNLFSHKYELTVHGRGSYAFELGADPFGNLTRLNNIFSGLQGKLEQAQQRLAIVEGQLENAKREVSRPFPQEQELAEKQARLAELNSRLNIDERSSEASLIDEDARDEKGDAPEAGDAADAPEESFSCEARADFSGCHIAAVTRLHFHETYLLTGQALPAPPRFLGGKNFGRNPF